jgi:ubiquinone/menaquinone biosynthesis C-methylase UbiE
LATLITTRRSNFLNLFDSDRWARLQTLEQVFDPASRRRIQSTGIAIDWQCLEVGAGEGSIVEWLMTVVRVGGKVTAIDRDVRFLDRLDAPL